MFKTVAVFLTLTSILAGCKTTHWFPEEQIERLAAWESGDEVVLTALDGREVTPNRHTYLVLDHGEDSERLTRRFQSIHIDTEAFVGQPAVRNLPTVILPREALRLGATRRDWRKTGIVIGVITGILVLAFTATFVGINIHCNRNPDAGGCDGGGDDWD